MASMLRLPLSCAWSLVWTRPSSRLPPLLASHVRLVSTSGDEKAGDVEDVCNTGKKNWMSYGFDHENVEDDRNATHSTFFFSVTCCLVLGGFLFAYMPDFQMRDWAQREAYLELRRREADGLPLIDPNLIDPAKFQLPSDEDLADTDIIV